MENSQEGNGKKWSQVLTYVSANNITKLNELIYVEANLVCEKIGTLLKCTTKKSKPVWEIRLKTDKKATK